MPKVIGLIGGGQLGMMIAEAAASMRDHVSRVIVLDPTPDCPAAQAGAEQIVAGFDDEQAISRLAERADVITYEIESGNADALEAVSGMAQVSPSPQTLRTIQDKLRQKEFLARSGLPVPEFADVPDERALASELARFGGRGVLKARRGGYDGRGNLEVGADADAAACMDHFGQRPVMLERVVDFEAEVSVIAARSTSGEIASYPLVENVHKGGILRMTIAPARMPASVAERAGEIARSAVEMLRGAGVFGIEMFVERGGGVMINEIAPRVHNSGHHTLQSSATSQFEQHLRAVLGLRLGSVELERPAVMYNILGPEGLSGAYRAPAPRGDGVFVKMYNKAESRPLRKLGHANIIGEAGASVDDILERVSSLRRDLEVSPA